MQAGTSHDAGTVSAAAVLALDDETLAVRARSDVAAFEELYARYRPEAQRMARRAASRLPRLDVSDVTALAMTRLWTSLRSYDPDRPFAPWAAVVMSRAVRSAASAALTAKSQFNWWAMLQRDDEGESGVVGQLEQAHVGSDAADAPLLLSEEEQTIAALLDLALSDREATVLRLRLAGWGHADIAVRTGLTTKAVDNALRRGRDKLRAELHLPDDDVEPGR